MVVMQPESTPADQKIALLAARAHGVVTRVGLRRTGVTPEEIKQRISHGSLIRVHRGVYRVGHLARSLEADYIAAVFACGRGALLCGRAAAHLFGLIKGQPPEPEVLAPESKRVPGLRTRRSRRLGSGDRTIWRGIPVTTAAWTMVDLAAELEPEDLARACHEAGIRHGTTPRQVEVVLERRPNAPGAAKLRGVLRGDTQVTLSKLERMFLSRLHEAGLPLPETNRRAGGRGKRVDCRWPARRLTVELDSYRFHSSRHAWEQDRKREREAHARGDQFRRYTWRDVAEDPSAMLGELRGLLA